MFINHKILQELAEITIIVVMTGHFIDRQRHRIGTADVEGSLIRHPAVAESAVVGIPDPIKGENIKAFVVVRAGVSTGPGLIASLKDHVREDLGGIAVPADIELRASLPKTRSGKILRRALKAEAMGQDPGDLSTLAD